jgi:hypothetical protein
MLIKLSSFKYKLKELVTSNFQEYFKVSGIECLIPHSEVVQNKFISKICLPFEVEINKPVRVFLIFYLMY